MNIDIPGRGELLVASVHARPEPFPGPVPDNVRRAGEEHAWWNDVIFADLARLVDGRAFIVGGDWNTCRAFDGVRTKYSSGPAFFERAEAHGWTAADPGDEPTWWDRRGNGYQLDHVFVGDGVKVHAVSVDRAPVDAKLSDHAAMRLTVSL